MTGPATPDRAARELELRTKAFDLLDKVDPYGRFDPREVTMFMRGALAAFEATEREAAR